SEKYVHAFTDGRDVDPNSGKGFIEDLQVHLEKTGSKLASIVGRYYSMDRDKRWERTKVAYDLVVDGKGEKSTNAPEAIQKSYDEGVTDEFIKPIVITDAAGNPVATLKKEEVVIFFNFRTDRGRQLTDVLTQRDLEEQGMKAMPLYYVTMTRYDESFNN
ncbi:2,3-bisphosphoglycerate-independent phosphoglycerate mutase, partial [Salinimicrobium sp. CDJ15-91]|nr:2,3-bisphosphoglycerate-independent phosphoglycerate mutase [Salinimicrobium oceani]